MDFFIFLAQQSGDGAAAGALFVNIIYLALGILTVAGLWMIFEKAGKPGWAAIIPIYNVWVLLEIVEKPGWWLVLFFIPVVNFIVAILVYIDLAKMFGKGAGFGIGMAFLPFIFAPMLGFGDAQYVGA